MRLILFWCEYSNVKGHTFVFHNAKFYMGVFASDQRLSFYPLHTKFGGKQWMWGWREGKLELHPGTH